MDAPPDPSHRSLSDQPEGLGTTAGSDPVPYPTTGGLPHIPPAPDNGLEKAAAGVAGIADGIERGFARLEPHAPAAYDEMSRFGQRTAAAAGNASHAFSSARAGTRPSPAYGNTPPTPAYATPTARLHELPWQGPGSRPARPYAGASEPGAAPHGGGQAFLRKTSQSVRHAAEEVRVRAEAVKETSRRARIAPKQLAQDYKLAAKAYAQGFTKGLVGYAIAGFLGLAAGIVFTVFLVQGLNMLMGAPWGALVVAVLYGAIAAVFIGRAKKAQAKARTQAAARLAHAKQELRSVTRPVRQAFRGTGASSTKDAAKAGASLGHVASPEALQRANRETMQSSQTHVAAGHDAATGIAGNVAAANERIEWKTK